ncbi:MAG: hypothetical protein WAN92_03160 [Herbaspirillum sp.]
MQKMMMNETELATRWNLSPKTLQRWRSEGRGPRYMKMSKRVVYPIDEIFDFESRALHSATWAKAPDVVLPSGSKLMDAREISYVTALPLYVFTQKQVRDALSIPYRRVGSLIRFDYAEVIAWVKRWTQEAEEQGIHAQVDPSEQRRSLQQALASLPA